MANFCTADPASRQLFLSFRARLAHERRRVGSEIISDLSEIAHLRWALGPGHVHVDMPLGFRLEDSPFLCTRSNSARSQRLLKRSEFRGSSLELHESRRRLLSFVMFRRADEANTVQAIEWSVQSPERFLRSECSELFHSTRSIADYH